MIEKTGEIMKKRRDSFFGLHFDMHANEYSTNIGSEFNNKLVEQICEEVQPDYIQVDTKGHPGYSSYPTKYGCQAPNISQDILKIWRDITKKYDIALYAHYSGVIDRKQAKLHPEWTVRYENGELSSGGMSFFGDYAKEILIPQLIEIAKDYCLNGVWVDGECWGVEPDYSQMAETAFGKKLPKKGEEGYREYQDFIRKNFVEYVKNYIREVKKVVPDFEMTSNWMNSPEMPEEISITDFISGDLSPTDSIDSARLAARMIASYKRPWDIMSWGTSFPVHYVKSAVQLCQEAASVIMLGGGFQIYNMQDPNKTLQNEWITPILKQVSEFCRERQSFCHQAKAVPDVGLLYSIQSYYHKKETIFGTHGLYTRDVRGLISALCDNGLSAEIVLPSVENLSDYSIVAIANGGVIEEGLKDKILNYVKNGGTLIVTGTESLELFRDELQILESERVTDSPLTIIRGGEMRALMKQNYVKVKTNAQVCNVMNVVRLEGDVACTNPPPKKSIGEEIPSVIECSCGKGKIVAIPFDFGLAYNEERSSQLRTLLGEIVDKSSRKLYVNGSHYLETALMEKNGKTYIHLLNTAGEHRAARVKVFDEILSICNVSVVYKLENKPTNVTLVPENIPLTYEYENGELKVNVNKVEIHSAIEITC